MNRTIALIRQLRAYQPARSKRIGRWQPPRPPTTIALRYLRAMRPIVEGAVDLFERDALPRILHLLAEERRAQGKMDASEVEKVLARRFALAPKSAAMVAALNEVDITAAAYARKLRPREMFEVVKQFGQDTDAHARQQLDLQLRAAIGLPLSAIEKPVRDKIDPWAERNVYGDPETGFGGIVTLPQNYFDRLKVDVIEAFEQGESGAALQEKIAKSYGSSMSEAEVIARDQIGKLTAQVNDARLQNLGVTRYRWRSARDGRVRDNHYELAQRSARGETFAFDDPPMDGGTNKNEAGNPGSGIQCRCFAEPVLDELING